MRFDTVKSDLNLSNAFDVLQAEWGTSEELSAAKHVFSEDSPVWACEYVRMPDEAVSAFVEAYACLVRNPPLLRLATHLHHLLFHSPDETHWNSLGAWPPLPASFGMVADMFYASVLLSGLHHTIDLHRARSIPQNVTVATLEDLPLWMREFRKLHGRWGLAEHGWLIRHFKGRIHTQGRLQFSFDRFPFDYHVWRSRKTGVSMILAGKGMRFRKDGQWYNADRHEDSEASWVADYEERDGLITGFRIASDLGAAIREPVSLSKSEWEPVLEQHAPVLGVHIPATGPMTPAACHDSFLRAMEFFPAHYPEFTFAGFDCDSWLLDAQLAHYLPMNSNIVQFQRRFHLYPIPGANDFQTIERVFGFGIREFDPESAPQDTCLRRVVVEHMKCGGHWRLGGGLIPRNEIPV